jgi:hypothetical protein
VVEGCKAETDYFSVTGAADTDAPKAQRAYRWPAQLPPLWNDLDLDLLKSLDSKGAPDIPAELDDIRFFLAASTVHTSAAVSRIALWSTMAALACAVAFATWWTWRNKRRLQRKMRALLVMGTDRLLNAMAARGERLQDVEQLRALLPHGAELRLDEAAPADIAE